MSMRRNHVFPVMIFVGCAAAYTCAASPVASELVDVAGIEKGICAVIHGDVQLALDLANSTEFQIYLMVPGEEVKETRATVAKANLPLRRMVVDKESGVLPFADGLVDLVVANSRKGVDLDLSEVHRVLRPKGKVLIAAKDGYAYHGGWELNYSRGYLVGEKQEPAGMDDWSHWERGPDNNPVSRDSLIRAPYRTQWLGLPYYIAMPAITTVAGGRTFVAMGHIAHHEREEEWLNTILARNGYNGSELWRRRVPDGYLMHRSAFIATDDTFYMIDPDNPGCILLDPETGVEKKRIAVPESGREWKWIALQGHILYALGGEQRDPAETTVVRSEIPAWSWGELSKGYYEEPKVPWGFGETLLAYDLDTGKVVWSHREPGIDSRAIAIGDGRMYYYSPDARLGCLDAATGKMLWVNEDPAMRQLINEPGQGLTSTPGFKTTCYCVYTPLGLFFEAQTQMNLVAVSKEDGHVLWSRKKTTSNPNIIYKDGAIYSGVGPEGNTVELDPATGETRRDLGFCKRSCARLTATTDSLFCRGFPEGVTRYDLATQTVSFDGSMRPACNDGVIGANGLLYIGPWLCDCNLSIMGTAALASAPGAIQARPAEQRLEFARADCAAFPSSKKDWPVYRGGNDHTGASRANVSGPLEPLWTWKPAFEGAVSAPVAAGGAVFVGDEEGVIAAIDAVGGKERWRYQTAGPIMQPPTIWNGRAYAGSGDGRVYCLEAATGQLLWSFDASRVARVMPVYGYLCSTWPVNSGVLIHDGIAYFAAGIVDYDGTYVYAVDAVSGKLKWSNDSSGWLNEKLRKGVSAQGNLTIANGRLYVAGGNLISPAEYDIRTGEYLGKPPKDGSPESNRGEEIGVFGDEYLIFGGRLRYSSYENVVNPGIFAVKGKSGVDCTLAMGQTAPAWDDELVMLARDRHAAPSAYSSKSVVDWVGRRGKDVPQLLWNVNRFNECQTLSLAVAKNGAVAVVETPRERDFRPRHRLMVFDRDQGKLICERDLPGTARQNSIAIDADGRVLVGLLDGRVCCYGGSDALQAYLENLASSAGSGAAREETVRRITAGLNDIHSQKERDIVVARLREMGVDVYDDVKKSGCIYQWQLLGPAPYDPQKDAFDENAFPGERVDVKDAASVKGHELAWMPYRTAHSTGMIDLVGVYGEHSNVAAYGYAEINLPEAGDVLLKVGSNDGFVCWFNGEKVGAYEGGRIYKADQDNLKVSGRKGVNTVLVKIVQQAGGWGFGVRTTDPAGKPIQAQE